MQSAICLVVAIYNLYVLFGRCNTQSVCFVWSLQSAICMFLLGRIIYIVTASFFFLRCSSHFPGWLVRLNWSYLHCLVLFCFDSIIFQYSVHCQQSYVVGDRYSPGFASFPRSASLGTILLCQDSVLELEVYIT